MKHVLPPLPTDWQDTIMANTDIEPCTLTPGEAWTVLDAIANDEDAQEALEEYCFWRSPRGRYEDAREAEELDQY